MRICDKTQHLLEIGGEGSLLVGLLPVAGAAVIVVGEHLTGRRVKSVTEQGEFDKGWWMGRETCNYDFDS